MIGSRFDARARLYYNVRGAAFAFSALLLGAAPARWPMYQYHADHNAAFAAAEPPYHWRYRTRGKINGGVAIAGHALYVETFAPSLLALDRRTGRLLWRTGLPGIAMTTPIVADGLVAIGTGTSRIGSDEQGVLVWSRPGGDEVAAFDARTGHLRWRHHTVGEDMPSPALVRIAGRDAIVFANGDDHVRALDMKTGRTLWSRSIAGIDSMGSAAAVGGTVYLIAGTAAGSHRPDHVYAVRANDGTIAWKAPYGNADSSPTVAGGRVFVEDSQTIAAPPDRNGFNTLYALAASSGKRLWSHRSQPGFFTKTGTKEQAMAAMVDGPVVFESLPAARRFAAFDVQTGHVLWSIRTAAAVKMSAVAYRGRVYVGDSSGTFYTVGESDGRVLGRAHFPSYFTSSSPAIVGSTLYAANDETVIALALTTGSVPASPPR